MTAMAASAARQDRGVFLRSRLGSLLAVMPLSVWTLNHLWNNLAAFQGAEAWQREVTEYPHPLAFFASSAIALLPIALHTIWGLARIASARPNNVKYTFYGNLKYALQRLSAIGVLLFIGAHTYLAMLKPRLKGSAEAFADIAHEMHHHGPTLAVYTLGILGVAYHLANGLHTFTMGWGLVSTRRALRRLEVFSIGFFLLVLGVGWAVVYALWNAGTGT